MTAIQKKWKHLKLWAGEVEFLECLESEGGDRTQEQYVSVAGDTADTETGQFLILKRFRCPVDFCNFDVSISDFYTIVPSVFHYFVMNMCEFIQAGRCQSSSINRFSEIFKFCCLLYGTFTVIFSVVLITRDTLK